MPGRPVAQSESLRRAILVLGLAACLLHAWPEPSELVAARLDRFDRIKEESVEAVSGPALAAFQGGRGQASAELAQWKEIPPVEMIEENLLRELNEVRRAEGLLPLRLSPELVRLARLQSREMAGLGILMHYSASGKTLKERLNDAGVLYKSSGENVARSESFHPLLIHESFMSSPEHKANILTPDFDEVGIGIVLSPDKGYFVTVEFVASLVPKTSEEVRSYLRERLNGVRRSQAVPDLDPIPEADELAASYSRSRSAGRRFEAEPSLLGKATIVFAEGPDLEGIGDILAGQAPTSPPAAGIGSWFGRNERFPGGAYYVCAILLHENPALELKTAQMTEAVFEAANSLRRARNLPPLAVDSRRSKILQDSLARARSTAPPIGAWIVLYETPDLTSFPEAVRSKIEDKFYGRIGLAVVRSVKKSLAATYTVAILLDESPLSLAARAGYGGLR